MESVSPRAEIDTRPPFRSVKEAVSLFGERVLAGELYSPAKLQSIHAGKTNGNVKGNVSKLVSVTLELEEAKQSLQKAREEAEIMANSISSLKEELERTRRQLQELKQQESQNKQIIEFGIEDLEYVEESPKRTNIIAEDRSYEFQKKRYVTFSNPSIAPVAKTTSDSSRDPTLESHPSLNYNYSNSKKNKKINVAISIPLFGGIFSKKNKA